MIAAFFMTIGILLLLAGGSAAIFLIYRSSKYWKKQVERSLKMVPLLVMVTRDFGSKDEQARSHDDRETMKEMIAVAETFYSNLSVLDRRKKLKNFVMGTPHIAMEIVAKDKEIFFYFSVPYDFISLVEKAITSHYSGAVVERVEEHNIFNPEWGIDKVAGGEFKGGKNYHYPINTYREMDNEPLENITNTLSKLEPKEGAAIQILIRPVSSRYNKKSNKFAKNLYEGKKSGGVMGFIWNVIDLINNKENDPQKEKKITPMEEEVIKQVEKKAAKLNFETVIRVVASSASNTRSKMILKEIESAFGQFANQSSNKFKFTITKNTEEVVTDYIFRFFMKRFLQFKGYLLKMRGANLVLSTEELATIFHLPNFLVQTPGIRWLASKKAAPPTFISEEGAVLGHSLFRGEDKVIKLAENDRRRHVYILGQTGSGKTTTMINMLNADIKAGKGVCYIDPHGQDLIDHVLPYIPKERAEDVIIFDASDIERPLGLNVFEAKTQEEKDFIVQEVRSFLYKLYDPGNTGQIFGPRWDHWFRMASLLLMADPNGSTLIDLGRIYTDEDFLARKFRHVTDPVVKNFILNEYAKTSERDRSEMVGYFVGKFSAFMGNETMRNIMGQIESSFNIRDIMDGKKILLINLSKGLIGDLNMRILGMIFVSKILMAAMSRADIPEEQRNDFYLYVDEFQNFATETFSSILSEARKFRLNLIVTNQYIGQMPEDVKDAIFGNVGSLLSFRIGNDDAEYLAKQFTPYFNQQDLINLENFTNVTKILVNGKPSYPFSMAGYNYPPGEDPEVARAVKELSRLKFGRPREIVNQEILERMKLDDHSIRNQSAGGNIPQVQEGTPSPPLTQSQEEILGSNQAQANEPVSTPTTPYPPSVPAVPPSVTNQPDTPPQPPLV